LLGYLLSKVIIQCDNYQADFWNTAIFLKTYIMSETKKVRTIENCYHCGDTVVGRSIVYDEKPFCCQGCATVYGLLSANNMQDYYRIENNPGVKVGDVDSDKYAWLDLPEVQNRLLSFKEGKSARITLKLPAIHCSSCIWLLENLYRINAGINYSNVNFTKKESSILFDSSILSLRQVVELLVKLGYTPELNLSTFKQEQSSVSQKLVFKIGVAGFCFGNIMLLSLPDYLGMGEGFETYAQFFGYLNIFLSLPVFFYAASDYYKSAWASLRVNKMNIDVPITLGIFTLFGRSLYEILTHAGSGYMDSLAGLLFFLLVGKWFQEKTYEALAFDRNYESYFPVAAIVLNDNVEQSVPLKDLKPGMHIVVKNRELIPADAVLISDFADIDFSFVTGESKLVRKRSDDFIYAGGRQSGPAIHLKVIKPVNQSYLTELWNQQVFKKPEKEKVVSFINSVSQRFTIAVLIIAAIGAVFWWIKDPSMIATVVTAVLIVACPCALALSAPFAFGHTIRALGKMNFYLRNSENIEKLANVSDIVFDKTGTLTRNDKFEVEFIGDSLKEYERDLIANLVYQSSHPLSKAILQSIGNFNWLEIDSMQEHAGKGLTGTIEGQRIIIGSESFVTGDVLDNDGTTRVFVRIDSVLKGFYLLDTGYRQNMTEVLHSLSNHYQLHILSGDNNKERERLSKFVASSNLHFSQTPFDKLQYIEQLQKNGKSVMMFGDGLNDAGALKAANVGVSVTDNIFDFTPACDAIMDGNSFSLITDILKLSKLSMLVIKWCIVISFLYNLIGLSFALSGLLSPLVAAILMPLSSISVVIFTTVAINMYVRKKHYYHSNSMNNSNSD
jgi:Cu+-exporting ATPase